VNFMQTMQSAAQRMMHALAPLFELIGDKAALCMLAFALGLAVYSVLANPQGRLLVLWEDYQRKLHREFRGLFIDVRADVVARVQLWVSIALVILSVVLNEILLVALVVAVVWLPLVILRQRREARLRQLDMQIDSWLVIMSNALSVAPSLGDALRSSSELVRAPLAEELGLVLKQMQLGTPLDQALHEMAQRTGSMLLAGVLSTILVGRRTGGNLPILLEENAQTLREMARLAGVIRSKTASARSQAYFLAAVPFVIIGGMRLFDKNWMEPLTRSALGYTIIGGALVCWMVAVFLARRIMAVDI